MTFKKKDRTDAIKQILYKTNNKIRLIINGYIFHLLNGSEVMKTAATSKFTSDPSCYYNIPIK